MVYWLDGNCSLGVYCRVDNVFRQISTCQFLSCPKGEIIVKILILKAPIYQTINNDNRNVGICGKTTSNDVLMYMH